MTSKPEKKKLGDILIERGIISKIQLDEALKLQKTTGLRLGELLLKKGIVTEEDLLSSLAEHYDIPFEKKLEYSDPEGLLKDIPPHFLNKNRFVPFSIK
ncbi:MAG TPA: type II secretion system protein GspE, partial [Spirochaetota bacterium]|nr:type II secretion system protein GspE [Spirochaetota bacterium]